MDEVIADTLAALPEAKARELLLRLSDLGVKAALAEFNRGCQVAFAVELLNQGVLRPRICQRLVERYGLKPRTAYARIDLALQQFCKPGR